jgi:type I restriction enzyme S subunit
LKKKDVVDSVIFKGDDNKYFEKKDKDIICIDEEIPFEIPDTWVWVRLEDICEYIQRGKSPKYSPVKKYPVIAQKCNQWSGFSIEKAQFIAPETISSYGEERKLQDRDLLWNSTGLGTLGRMAIYYSKLNPYELAVADSHVTVIRALKQYVCPEYLYAYFTSPTVQSVIEDKSDGSTKQKELATNTVKAYLVPLPPYEEQQRIIKRIKDVSAHLM